MLRGPLYGMGSSLVRLKPHGQSKPLWEDLLTSPWEDEDAVSGRVSAEEDGSDQLDQEPDGPHHGDPQGHQLQVQGELVPVALVSKLEDRVG